MALRPYQYVEVDNFLHLRRRLTVSQFIIIIIIIILFSRQ